MYGFLAKSSILRLNILRLLITSEINILMITLQLPDDCLVRDCLLKKVPEKKLNKGFQLLNQSSCCIKVHSLIKFTHFYNLGIIIQAATLLPPKIWKLYNLRYFFVNKHFKLCIRTRVINVSKAKHLVRRMRMEKHT